MKRHISLLFIIACIHSYPSIKAEIFLALFCGLRTGEIRGLRFDDGDKTNHTIHIQRQVVKKTILTYTPEKINLKKGGVQIKAPKTESSDRILKVHPVIFDVLDERKEEIEHRRKQSKTWTNQFEGYVSIGEGGNIKSDSTIRAALQRIAGYTGLPIVSTHDLRHMAATLLFEACIQNSEPTDVQGNTEPYPYAEALRRVSRYLGHGSVKTTYEIYIGQQYAAEQIRKATESVMNPISSYGREDCGV